MMEIGIVDDVKSLEYLFDSHFISVSEYSPNTYLYPHEIGRMHSTRWISVPKDPSRCIPQVLYSLLQLLQIQGDNPLITRYITYLNTHKQDIIEQYFLESF